jgi:hypothetical protein
MIMFMFMSIKMYFIHVSVQANVQVHFHVHVHVRPWPWPCPCLCPHSYYYFHLIYICGYCTKCLFQIWRNYSKKSTKNKDRPRKPFFLGTGVFVLYNSFRSEISMTFRIFWYPYIPIFWEKNSLLYRTFLIFLTRKYQIRVTKAENKIKMYLVFSS